MDRKLDGVYFKVKRNDKCENVCISDMTDDERKEVLKDKNEEFLRKLVDILANTIHDIGEQLDLYRD